MNARGVLRGRARALRNALFGRGAKRAALRPRGPLYSLALVAVAAWIVHSGFAALLAALARSGAPPAVPRAALALALDVALVGVLLFDLESAVSTLILDRDLDLLRAAPLPPRSILAIKLLDALPRAAAPLVVVALPALSAAAQTLQAPAAAWLAAPVVLALLWAIPLGAGTALALAWLARVPARRVRESLGLVSTLAFAALWLTNLFVLPRIAAEEGEPLERVRALLAAAAPALARTPGGWAAALLGGAPAGEIARSAGALAAAAAASVALAALVASRHLTGVLAAARTPVARPARRRAKRPLPAGSDRTLPARSLRSANSAHPLPTRPARRVPLFIAVMRRDRRLFVRDWTVLGDVLTAALLWTCLPLLALPLRPLRSPWLVRAMLLALAVGLGYEIAARAFPLERRGAAWMRLAPVRARSWAAARLASAGALALALVGVAGASLGLAARLGAEEWLATLAAVIPALALSVTLGLWTGAAFGDPTWTNPRAVLTLGGRLVAAALVVAQMTGWLVLTAAEESASGSYAWLLPWLPGLAAIGLSAVAVGAVARRIHRGGYAIP